MEYIKPYVIAEAGCNHKGDMNIAKEMIEVAALFCKADAIKFQKRCNRELLTEEQYIAPSTYSKLLAMIFPAIVKTALGTICWIDR